jgi:hypothetical protein
MHTQQESSAESVALASNASLTLLVLEQDPAVFALLSF